ncbi:exopolysaccharide biosynthesis polyprenyl glycosylphosphotransferase [Rhodoblastus acidophilus]|uniref:Exopolysaccharide biosynthesis polyprenyl glycosylphosphotransferase n=1 Tax=Candidatus Rhodoblastus alkanivorans TaxID=2954117 RepID=A0ABS9ZA14_9HYPH|nr:exopolysaccharide biosynthesis polyprenyl glycosylphosphotransferase [Candidatus Rhodoblastus alkanivorans]MCI4678737.1 exopolysaccharide biosynthesis polyprenyl glycosylphosphotransferase [Candidatus Rhodoblastus alkanivorans]MCI4683467.1 exopolysaccharide biosynthesis polyprenyl glycosylphosphotransferase [Candidatus Rhodoblastus alkanivorans]MDI4640781.1 exopolysaccharide biosynthesis polyprenyl glycosylphosphotransferase [Rhodoblastus acidophilus]
MADVAFRGAAVYGDRVEKTWASAPGNRISLENFVVFVVAIDVLALLGCGLAASLFLSQYGRLTFGRFDDRAVIVGLSALLYLLISRAIGAHRTGQILNRRTSLNRLMAALALTFIALLVIGAATKTTQNFSRIWFFSWFALACSLAPTVRLGLLAAARRRLAQGDFVFRALSVGVFAQPLSIAELDAASGGMAQVAHIMALADLEDLEGLADWIAREEIDQIYVVTPWAHAPATFLRLRRLRQFSAEIFVVPDDASIRAHQLGVGVIHDRVALRAGERPINGWDRLAKRMQDIVVASAALLFVAPVMLLIAAAIKLDSPGPVLFRQKRAGFNGRPFELLKFRSMYAHAADAHASRQTSRDDARVTKVGRFIRRASLDELPQFFNVLRGEMSVVGPRPHALQTRTNGLDLRQIADRYAARHRVRPGLTGLAQVNGCRGELDNCEKVVTRVDFDINYIENWSTWLDCKIILRTALLLFFDRAAY